MKSVFKIFILSVALVFSLSGCSKCKIYSNSIKTYEKGASNTTLGYLQTKADNVIFTEADLDNIAKRAVEQGYNISSRGTADYIWVRANSLIYVYVIRIPEDRAIITASWKKYRLEEIFNEGASQDE